MTRDCEVKTAQDETQTAIVPGLPQQGEPPWARPNVAMDNDQQAPFPSASYSFQNISSRGAAFPEARSPMLTGRAEVKKTPSRTRAPMRSSIACLRCRKSKIKCDNDGGNTSCESCIKSGNHCQYPDNVSTNIKRPEPPTSSKQDKEPGHERKRSRRSENLAEHHQRHPSDIASDALSLIPIDEEAWDQLFACYKLHYASELSFVHIPTLRERMRDRVNSSTDPSQVNLNLLLLGILTLTCRFHANLSKRASNLPQVITPGLRSSTNEVPHAATKYYATALAAAVGTFAPSSFTPSIERVQALLMLGYHEWTHGQAGHNIAAWMYTGMAIRLAEGMLLGSEPVGEHSQSLSEFAPGPGAARRISTSEMAVTREISRRTMFSCFLVDRMLSSASGRNPMVSAYDLKVQLPCSDMALDLARDVFTGYLRMQEHNRDQPLTDESVLSCFIRLSDIWGDVAKYSISGGSTTEKDHLWAAGTSFRSLWERVDRFIRLLPETFSWSRQNFYRHDNHQATSSYVTLHMLTSLCQIILHRESFPFFPLRCGQPEEQWAEKASTWAPYSTKVPPRVWADSADRAFSGARDVLEIVELCRDKVPISPTTAFAITSAGVMSMYAHYFPHLDRHRYLSSGMQGGKAERGRLAGDTVAPLSYVFETLGRMSPHLTSVEPSIVFLRQLDSFFAYSCTLASSFEQNQYGATAGPGQHAPVPRPYMEGDGRDRQWARATPEEQPSRGSFIFDPVRAGSEASGGPRRLSLDSQPASRDPVAHLSNRPTAAFTAINESPRVGLARSAPSLASPESGPGNNTVNYRRSWMTDFAVDLVPVLECWRIGYVLNDLQAFSGAGVLGGV